MLDSVIYAAIVFSPWPASDFSLSKIAPSIKIDECSTVWESSVDVLGSGFERNGDFATTIGKDELQCAAQAEKEKVR